MKKALPLACLLLAGALAFILLKPRSEPPTAPARPWRPPKSAAPRPTSGGSTSPLDSRALEILQSKDAAALRSLAKDWRRLARTNAAARGRVAAIVLDPAAPAEARELAAFVLGSLPDPDALDALLDALRDSTDAAWTRTLLLALGSAKESGEDDDVFGLGDSPRVVATPLGLEVRIRGAILEAGARARMTPQVREGTDPGVRWAAALALADSTRFPDVRRAFLDALGLEADPATQGEVGKALADWAAGEAAGTPDRSAVFDAILEGARRPDASALRLRCEDGMKRMSWTAVEVRAVAPGIESGSFDQRRWSMAVLAGAASRPDTPARDEVFEAIQRVASSDPDAKIRDLAVTAASSFPDRPQAEALLIGSLEDTAWHVRAAAARALGRMNRSVEILDALRRVEQGEADERVRRAIAETRRLLLAE
jgi:HEAT repeat protein